MYAIVKTGGKQYKVAEGDVIEVEKLDAAPGAEVALPPILLVDGDAVTHEADKLAKVAVTAEVRRPDQGPEDPDPQVQEQDRLPQAHGPPSAADPGQGHRHHRQSSARSRGRTHDMAHKKGASSSRNGRDSNAQYLGVKRFGGQVVNAGEILDPPARHQVPPRRRRRPRQGRHAVRAGRRARSSSALARGRKTVNIVAGRGLSRLTHPTARRRGRARATGARPRRCRPAGRSVMRHRHQTEVERRDGDASSTASCCTSPPATAATASPRSTARSSSRSAAPTAATAAAAATSCSSSTPTSTPCSTSTTTRTSSAGNGKQGAGSHRNGADGGDLELRVPDGTVVLDEDGEVLADLVRRRHPLRRGPGRPRRARQRRARLDPAQGARLRAARRARRGPRRRPRAQERRRRRPGRLPERGQVLADRRDVGRAAEDRRLPVHHAGAEPRRRQRRRHHLHRSPTSPA